MSVRVFNLLDGEIGEGEDVDVFVHRRAGVRHGLGAELIGCSLYEVPPGKRAWPYHHHDNNEEWLVVVDGRPTLRTPEGERELEPGDVAGFPQGEAGAHDISNRTDEPVRVAIFSTLRQGSVVYPDSDKIGAGPPWDRSYFRRADAVDYWDGEASE
jgi:uncharacterized cupin superfamily protein